LKILPLPPLPTGGQAFPKGGDHDFPLRKRSLRLDSIEGIEEDFTVILLISLASEIHFSKG